MSLPELRETDSECCLLMTALPEVSEAGLANGTLFRLRLYPICSQGGCRYRCEGFARIRVSGFSMERGHLGQTANFDASLA